MDGLIILDKPPGPSSARCVAGLKCLIPHKTKVGHAGTLDPFASGVLLILVGNHTRCCEQLMGLPKRYETTIKLGARTATDDPESTEVPCPQIPAPPARSAIETALKCFTGQIEQRPPDYSAVKLAGKRACDRVRLGQQVQLAPRLVRIDQIQILSYQWPLLSLRIDCGRGTYIRAIARDLGESLGVGGYLTALRRTQIGEYRIEQAVTMDQLNSENIARHLKQVRTV